MKSPDERDFLKSEVNAIFVVVVAIWLIAATVAILGQEVASLAAKQAHSPEIREILRSPR
jgi:succinate dehydrogenase hydrophobic anchor subunit